MSPMSLFGSMWEGVLSVVGSQRTADILDPFVFGVAKIVDAIATTLPLGIFTHAGGGINLDVLQAFKLSVGLILIGCALLLGWHSARAKKIQKIQKIQKIHYWPVVFTLFTWGSGCVAGAFLVQSFVICSPTAPTNPFSGGNLDFTRLPQLKPSP